MEINRSNTNTKTTTATLFLQTSRTTTNSSKTEQKRLQAEESAKKVKCAFFIVNFSNGTLGPGPCDFLALSLALDRTHSLCRSLCFANGTAVFFFTFLFVVVVRQKQRQNGKENFCCCGALPFACALFE